MIRIVALASLAALTALVLYLPSAYPPERFIGHMRTEHGLNEETWGRHRALRILDRALAMQGNSQAASPIATASAVAVHSPVDAALAAQISAATLRLFSIPYFRSIEALSLLGMYRVASLLEGLPVLFMFVVAALLDGFVRRIVKSKEFLQHDPETFAISASLLVLTCCATAIAFVLPVTLHPFLVAAMPLVVGVFGGVAIANFHARG